MESVKTSSETPASVDGKCRSNMLETSLEWLRQGRKVAAATVIATWGSAPRPVGSQMLVDAAGNFEGSVSGGCIEGAVITEALNLTSESPPCRLKFGVSNEQAWEAGLACGGRIEICIEPVNPHASLIEKAAAIVRSGRSACLITDLNSGEKSLARPDTVSGASSIAAPLEKAVIRSINTGNSRFEFVEAVPYFIHLLHPEPKLFIVGAVHTAGPLARMARLTGFEVMIIDPRSAFASVERFPDIALNTQWPDEALASQTLHQQTAVVTLTHDPKLDDAALEAALASEAFYIGSLGSRKTHSSRIHRLERKGFTRETLDRIHGPVGLSIGAVTPEELAVAVMAQIIQCYRAKRRNPFLSL